MKKDKDEAELLSLNKDSTTAKSGNYRPLPYIYTPYEQSAMEVRQTAKPATAAANTASRRIGHGIVLNHEIKMIEYLQKPYKDVQLARHEAAVRRNWAIQTAISVREFFMFAEPSELIVELSDAHAYKLKEPQKQEAIEKLTERLKGTPFDIEKLIKAAHTRDEKYKLETKLKTAYWQVLTFGDAYILKLYKKDKDGQTTKEIAKLYPINSRRVSELIPDPDNHMSIEGAWVDGQALDKNAMLQFHYQSNQISAHTEGYGYTPLESILNLAEGLNIFYEEDVKEIQRSAWLSSILLQVNTAGLTRAQSKARIKSIVDEIDPGKIIGVGGQGENGLQAQSLDLKSDLNGLAAIGENQEAKIFKAFRVPQFLVQSEDIANRATADKSAELFLSGVIQADQTWLSDILEEQWYEPFIRESFGLAPEAPLPFKIRRKFNIPLVSEFVDLADGLVSLVQSGIWDMEQANEKLGTPEVADRLSGMEMQMPQPGQAGDVSFSGRPNLDGMQPYEQRNALSNMEITPSIKPRASQANLSGAVKKKKLELLQNVIRKLNNFDKMTAATAGREFDESKHKRDEHGKFAEKEGSGDLPPLEDFDEGKEDYEPWAFGNASDVEATNTLNSLSDQVYSSKKQYADAIEKRIKDPKWLEANQDSIESYMGSFEEYQKLSPNATREDYLRRFEEDLRSEPELQESFVPDLKEGYDQMMTNLNGTQEMIYYERLSEAESLWRGTTFDELDSYLEHAEIGPGGGNYNFVSLSVNKMVAESFTPQNSVDAKVMIEFPKEQIEDSLVSQGYDVTRHGDTGSIDGIQGRNFLFEEEHRLPPQGMLLSNLNLKIHIGNVDEQYREQIQSQYGSLGELIFHDNFKSMVASVGNGYQSVLNHILRQHHHDIEAARSTALRFVPGMTPELFESLISVSTAAGYQDSQPRDEDGKWSNTGKSGSAEPVKKKAELTPADFQPNTRFEGDPPAKILRQVKQAWDTIPDKHKENLGDFVIRSEDSTNTVGGLYSNADKTMLISVADKDPMGIQYVLWHEINHHRFLHYENQAVGDWKRDYAELRARLGKGPSRYADSFIDTDHQAALDEYMAQTELLKENLAKSYYTPAAYFGREYTDLQHDLISIPKSIKDPKSSKGWKKRGKELLKEKKQQIKDLEIQFESLSDEDKRQGIEARLAQRKPRGNEIDNITANEAHSEIGGWIHASQSMREHGMANPDMAVNEDVIEEYAKLYREHFET